eukprot:NODE_3463_length_783_cov_212.030220.p2 GENE.NODE_3463_length_783_cov_212.030220~~NODE_3463_length_783_cov_212.030220.p2  ORF type:complete len:224 (+),score=53.03 NODE_3463_length_783_cov_212.030220:3-674(+)
MGTPLGRKQSLLTAQRLAAMAAGTQEDHYGKRKVQFSCIHSSDVLRARQTADIIAENLPNVPRMPPTSLLAEGLPAIPHPGRRDRYSTAKLWPQSSRIEAAFRAYCHRDVDNKKPPKKPKAPKAAVEQPAMTPQEAAGYFPEEDSELSVQAEAEAHVYEICVCHQNVIRYFVLRALQLPPEAWLRMKGDNCGLTELIFSADGCVSLGRFADTGHLPIEMTTFH